jgi:superfamily I DNA/RNA helicase
MSLHACKGLEFDCVLIVGLEERNLPSMRGSRNSLDADEVLVAAQADPEDEAEAEDGGVESEEEAAAASSASSTSSSTSSASASASASAGGAGAEEDRHLDEERRLLYVGMTRAKKRLLLVYRSRMSVGLYGGSTKLLPSRFLRDLPLDVPFVRAASGNNKGKKK